MLCVYHNRSDFIEVVQIPQRGWERTVWPRKKILFTAESSDFLEVISPRQITTMLSQRIRCDRLAWEMSCC
jgi:hypothetical protein